MTAESWRKNIISNMKKAGTYAGTYDAAVATLADLLEQRDAVYQQYVDEGCEALVEKVSDRGARNYTKNPLLATWMDLNRDALSYWRDLGLTPAGLKKLNEAALQKPEKTSALEKALANLASA